MAYLNQDLEVVQVSGQYVLIATTEWASGSTYLHNGHTVPDEPNSGGVYEIILEVTENSSGQSSVGHECSLAPMGVTPPDDADIDIIVKEGSTVHGTIPTTISTAGEIRRPTDPDLFDPS